MRELGPPSEIRRLAAPLLRLLDSLWHRMHWWIGAMGALYALSGITIVKPDEVAVVLRWGRLVGDTPALQQHGSGLLFALPRPIDRVVRVKVKRVSEVRVSTLNIDARSLYADGNTLDPLTQGYALTGDQNIIHVEMVARYRIKEPAEWAFYGPQAEEALRVEVTAAMVRSLGEMGVDRVLSDGRKSLIETATRRAQAGLDRSHSGLELTSLELTRLAPPSTLSSDFDAVQSAYIGAQTRENEAQAYVQTALPRAHAESDSAAQLATGLAESALAITQGESEAFRALYREYRANPKVVRERLYRDAVDRAVAAANDVRWIPPPTDGKYRGFRVSLTPVDFLGAVPEEGTTDSISTGDGGPPSASSEPSNPGAEQGVIGE